MSFENLKNEEDPKGYKPLELEYRDEHLWRLDGTLFLPDIEVGSERHQIDLFIEYERTFGRGEAFWVTHMSSGSIDPRILKQKYGSPENYYNLKNDYDKIRRKIAKYAKEGTKEETGVLIKETKEFRVKYPMLYDDADEHTEPGHF